MVADGMEYDQMQNIVIVNVILIQTALTLDIRR